MSTIGERIRERREALGLLQKEVAAKAGIGKACLSNLERSRNTPRASTVRKLAAALGVDPAAFRNGEAEPIEADEPGESQTLIPTALVAYADVKGLTVKQTLALLKTRAALAAGNGLARATTDWPKLHEAIQEFGE